MIRARISYWLLNCRWLPWNWRLVGRWAKSVCDHCEGSGEVWETCSCAQCEYRYGNGGHDRYIPCGNCEGRGRLVGRWARKHDKPKPSWRKAALAYAIAIPTITVIVIAVGWPALVGLGVPTGWLIAWRWVP